MATDYNKEEISNVLQIAARVIWVLIILFTLEREMKELDLGNFHIPCHNSTLSGQ